MWLFKKREERGPDRETIEQKLTFLAENGFQLEEPFTIDDLIKNRSTDRLEASGFEPASKNGLPGARSVAISGTSTRSALRTLGHMQRSRGE